MRVFVLILFFSSISPFLQAQEEWASYTDTTVLSESSLLIIQFDYPSDLLAESIENCRCVGQFKESEWPDDEVTNSMDWGLWIGDIQNDDIETNILYTKNSLEVDCTEKRETIKLLDSDVTRVSFYSKNGMMLYQLSFLKKYDIWFELNNTNPKRKGYDKYLHSLKIEKVKR